MRVNKKAVTCAVSAIIAIVVSAYPNEVRTNKEGLELIGNAESCRRDPYKCPADVLTVGIGSTGGNIQPGKLYTDKEIADRWVKDIKVAERCVNTHFRGNEMGTNTFSAMTSAVFNLGCYNIRYFTNSKGQRQQTTISKYAQAGNFVQMCERLPDFRRSGGKVLRGLEIRREKEMNLCLKDLK